MPKRGLGASQPAQGYIGKVPLLADRWLIQGTGAALILNDDPPPKKAPLFPVVALCIDSVILGAKPGFYLSNHDTFWEGVSMTV